MDLHLEAVSHNYDELSVLNDINLEIIHREIVCIVGPSGCGKSTLLRIIGGLEKPRSGQVLQLGEPPANSLNPLTFIFQDFALLPWRSVSGNISLALEEHDLSKSAKEQIIQDVLERTKLSEFADALRASSAAV